MGECNVKVVVRFRPINAREKQEEEDAASAPGHLSDMSVDFPPALSGEPPTVVNVMQGGKIKNAFVMDSVLQANVSQEDVFEATAKATVQDVVNGYNGTIFAYGQTGSGKSFSMFGPDIISPQRGIIPRACAFIFAYIRSQASNDLEVTIKCSFLEIYRETIRDLLNPNSNNLKVRETPSRGVWVDDLTEQYVSTDKEVIDLLKLGEKFRSVSATQMNAVSSRSHSLFVLTLQQKGRDGSSKTGKLNLADLAGSEKVEKTGAKGDTLEEAKKINQSLSALGNCINALTKAKRGHVPYRDSKLTFLLRESLGGNSKTTLIVCCSSHRFNLEETLSSLQFAQRAKTIKNTVKVNRQRSVEELNRIIAKLMKELEAVKAYCQTLEQEVLKLNPKFDVAAAKKQTVPAGQAAPALGTSPAPSITGFISSFLSSSPSQSPLSSLKDDLSDICFDDGMESDNVPTEQLSLAELQVELEKARENHALQLREHAEEIENLKDENESFRRSLATLEVEYKSERTASTLLRNQLQAEQPKNEARINKLTYENKQQATEMENLRVEIKTLDKQNTALQELLQRERETRRTSRSSKIIDPQQIQSQFSPQLIQTPLSPTSQTPRPQEESPPQEPERNEVEQEQNPEHTYSTELHLENNTALKLLVSLEDLLQQTEQEVSAETLHYLTNDLGALQLEFYAAKSEMDAMAKQLLNKDSRIAQLEAELKNRQDSEAALRQNIQTIVQESASKESDLTNKIYYLEEATRVARQREAVRVVRPIEVKPPILANINTSSASAFISSLFEPVVDLPPANSLTHSFKQGFLTKQGSRIKTWKKRFAILQGNVLYYYTPDVKREPRGKLELDNLCVVQEADEFTQKPLSLGIFHPLKQPFFCSVDSQQDRMEWIDAFKAACTVVPMKDV